MKLGAFCLSGRGAGNIFEIRPAAKSFALPVVNTHFVHLSNAVLTTSVPLKTTHSKISKVYVHTQNIAVNMLFTPRKDTLNSVNTCIDNTN